ncbi:MAG TPA: sulfur carrier protein ThiS [Gemmatimonadales bacterium]|jgi:thiamine biosynthesis protein ThiS|nr:sulfur carrier protein ThiS [Gemmatimonadales bacterium]
MKEFTVVLNGELHRLSGAPSLEDLLSQLELDPRAVVVELNRRIVRKQELAVTRLAEGDAIELVHFVGGG